MDQFKYFGDKANRDQLKTAEAELNELKAQIQLFEARVDDRLGRLLDQLSELRTETAILDEKLREIREQRLFGAELIRYLDGAPRPVRPINPADFAVPTFGKHAGAAPENVKPPPMEVQPLDIREVYRKLARRYHPDLARSDADRVICNEQMAVINHAYSAGDREKLFRLAGISAPFDMDGASSEFASRKSGKSPLTEEELVEARLKSVRQEIANLSRLPIVKLSLDAKLARRQGRDLLGELASDLKYKVRRKIAQRDYLESQIRAWYRTGDRAPGDS